MLYRCGRSIANSERGNDPYGTTPSSTHSLRTVVQNRIVAVLGSLNSVESILTMRIVLGNLKTIYRLLPYIAFCQCIYSRGNGQYQNQRKNGDQSFHWKMA